MLKEIVTREEPDGLYGGIYYDTEHPGDTWKISGAVGADALYEALSANPTGRLSPEEVWAGFQVIDGVLREVDRVIDEGGWMLSGKEPERLPAGAPDELLGDLRDSKIILTTPRRLLLDYGAHLASSSEDSDGTMVLVTPGLSDHLRYHVGGSGFRIGLTLLCGQKEQRRNIEVPKPLLNSLVVTTNRLVQAEASLGKLPFPSVQVVKQRFVDRSARIVVAGG